VNFMREQKINLEGRLGSEGKSRRSSYGISRLGIQRADSLQPDRPVDPSPAPEAPQPVRLVAPAPEPAESLTPQRGQGRGDLDQAQWQSEPPPAKSSKLLLAAGVAVVLSMVAWWFWPHGSPSPAPAAAPPAAAPASSPTSPQAAPAPLAGGGQTRFNPAPQPKTLPLAAPAEVPARENDPWQLEPAPPSTAQLAIVPPAKVRPSPAFPAAAGPAAPNNTPKPAANPPEAPGQPAFRLNSTLMLTAILKGSSPLAIINDHAVEVGQTIEGARIVAIGDFDVEVEIEGQHYMIGITAAPALAPASQPAQDKAESPARQPASQPAHEPSKPPVPPIPRNSRGPPAMPFPAE
jgi:hypothetical protein